MNEESLKPVIFTNSFRVTTRRDTHLQTLLLKALSEGVTNVDDLVTISGAKSAAQVLVTLDKLAIRKDYHRALSDAGLSMDSIVVGIKNLALNSSSDSVKLQSLQTLMRSLGLDKYEKDEEAGKSWEETILQLADNTSEQLGTDEEVEEYKVDAPIVPESVKNRQKEEKSIAKQLYEE